MGIKKGKKKITGPKGWRTGPKGGKTPRPPKIEPDEGREPDDGSGGTWDEWWPR